MRPVGIGIVVAAGLTLSACATQPGPLSGSTAKFGEILGLSGIEFFDSCVVSTREGKRTYDPTHTMNCFDPAHVDRNRETVRSDAPSVSLVCNERGSFVLLGPEVLARKQRAMGTVNVRYRFDDGKFVEFEDNISVDGQAMLIGNNINFDDWLSGISSSERLDFQVGEVPASIQFGEDAGDAVSDLRARCSELPPSNGG